MVIRKILVASVAILLLVGSGGAVFAQAEDSTAEQPANEQEQEEVATQQESTDDGAGGFAGPSVKEIETDIEYDRLKSVCVGNNWEAIAKSIADSGNCSMRVECYQKVLNKGKPFEPVPVTVQNDYNCDGKLTGLEVPRTRFEQLAESEFFNPSDPVEGLIAVGQNDNLANTTSGNPIIDFITNVMSFLVWLIGLASLVVLIVAAYYMLVAAGDEETISKGKEMVVLALTGMVIVIFSYMIVRLIQALIL